MLLNWIFVLDLVKGFGFGLGEHALFLTHTTAVLMGIVDMVESQSPFLATALSTANYSPRFSLACRRCGVWSLIRI
jgi:hypothetical protein